MTRTLVILACVLLACAHTVKPEDRAAENEGCDGTRVAQLASRLHPHISIGPPDESTSPDPRLTAEPDVIVDKLLVSFDPVTTRTAATVPDPKGAKQIVPAVQHRFVARAEAQVGLAGNTRKVRATEEARDFTWDADSQKVVPADDRVGVTYALSLNLASGDPGACEKQLGELAGAGIPVP